MCCVLVLCHVSSSALRHQCSWFSSLGLVLRFTASSHPHPILRLLDSDRDLQNLLPWFSDLWTWTEFRYWLPLFHSLQAADCRLLSLHNCMRQFLQKNLSLSIYVCNLLLVLFFWKTLTNTQSLQRSFHRTDSYC